MLTNMLNPINLGAGFSAASQRDIASGKEIPIKDLHFLVFSVYSC